MSYDCLPYELLSARWVSIPLEQGNVLRPISYGVTRKRTYVSIPLEQGNVLRQNPHS